MVSVSGSILDKFLLLAPDAECGESGLSAAGLRYAVNLGGETMGIPVNQGACAQKVLETEQIDGLLAAAGCEGVNQILEAFWRSTNALLGALKTHLDSQNWAEAARAAHALKGSSANVGAAQLSAAAREFETQCHTSDVDGAQKALADTGAAYERTKTAFHEHLTAFRQANNC